MTKVTYVPDADEPSETTWNGVTFKANVPLELTDKQGYEIEEGKRYEDKDGNTRIKTVHRFVTMIEMARGNPSFVVEDNQTPPPKRRGRPPKHLIPNAAEEHAKSIEISS